MRVTDWMRSNDLIYELSRRIENVNDLGKQIASGKRINKPSDDPAGTGKALHFRHRIARNEQHQRNVEDGLSNMSYLDGVLDGVSNLLNEALSKAVQGDNEALTAEDRLVLANEVDQLLEELLSKGNTSYSGKFIFGGYQSKSTPFIAERNDDGLITAVNPSSAGIDEKIEREIGVGLRESINIGGGEHFQPSGEGEADDMFQMLINLRGGLINNDSDVIGEQIDYLQDAIDHNSLSRSTIGAKINYFDRRLEQLTAAEVTLEDSLSKVEDVDLVEAALNFEQEQTAYTAAILVGAQIIQMSLVNFIG